MLKHQLEKGSRWGGCTQKQSKNRTTPTLLKLEVHISMNWGNLSFSRPLDQQSAFCKVQASHCEVEAPLSPH